MLEGDAAGKASIRSPGQRVTSALTIAETTRAVLRARLSGRITAEQHRAALVTLQRFARRRHIVSVTEAIRTLEAIHLATAEALGARQPWSSSLHVTSALEKTRLR